MQVRHWHTCHTAFLIRRYRTKQLLLEFKGDIPHDKLLRNLRTIIKYEITNYLIVSKKFIKGDVITYALLRFNERIDICEKNISVFLNKSNLKIVVGKIF